MSGQMRYRYRRVPQTTTDSGSPHGTRKTRYRPVPHTTTSPHPMGLLASTTGTAPGTAGTTSTTYTPTKGQPPGHLAPGGLRGLLPGRRLHPTGHVKPNTSTPHQPPTTPPPPTGPEGHPTPQEHHHERTTKRTQQPPMASLPTPLPSPPHPPHLPPLPPTHRPTTQVPTRRQPNTRPPHTHHRGRRHVRPSQHPASTPRLQPPSRQRPTTPSHPHTLQALVTNAAANQPTKPPPHHTAPPPPLHRTPTAPRHSPGAQPLPRHHRTPTAPRRRRQLRPATKLAPGFLPQRVAATTSRSFIPPKGLKHGCRPLQYQGIDRIPLHVSENNRMRQIREFIHAH